MSDARRALWKWWVLVVLIISGPWFGLVRQPQWQHVNWIPFADRADKKFFFGARLEQGVVGGGQAEGLGQGARRRRRGQEEDRETAGQAVHDN